MGEKKMLKTKLLHMIWVVLIFVLVILLMAVLKCEMATPAY